MSQKVYTFTVVEGEHQGVKKVYKKGDSFTSQYPLDKMFIGKFLRVSDTVPHDDTIRSKQVDTRLTFVFEDAAEVTEQYPLASDNDLRVFKDATGGFAITTAYSDGAEPLNIAPQILGSKAQVNSFLKAYLKSQVE